MSKQLARSTATVGFMTLLSRIAGFIRDVVIARVFGAGLAADAFFVAFKIPNFFRRIFAEGAFSQAFVPVFNEYQTRQEQEVQKAFVDRVAGNLALVVFGVTAIAIIFSPYMIQLFAPGFAKAGEKYELAVEMLRITFPYLLLISLASLGAGLLNSYGSFAIPAFAPVFLNISLILGAIAIAPFLDKPITGLAWGVVLGGVLQLAFQLPFLRRQRMLPRFKIDWQHPGVRRVFILMGPAIIGSSVVQVNLLVETIIASFLKDGSIAWLYYSDRLMEFPLGVFGIALSTVILPHLSKQACTESKGEFTRTLDWGINCTLLIGLPATIGLIMLAKPLFATLFQYGKFTPHDVEMAAKSLVAYAVGLQAFILVKVLSAGYFACQNTKTPVKIAVTAMASNVFISLALVFPLGHVGLALSTSLSGIINMALLFWTLKKKGIYTYQFAKNKMASKVIVCSAIMLIGLWIVVPSYEQWLLWSGLERVFYLLLNILLAVGLYGVALWSIGVRASHFLEREL